MPLGTFVLTIGGEQQDGTPETKARLHLLPQVVDTLIDADADEFKFPTKFAKGTGEGISLPYSITLFTDSDSGPSTTLGYKGYVATENGGRVDFKIQAQEAGTTKALTDLTDEVVGPISSIQQFRDEAEAAAASLLQVSTWARNPDLLVTGTITRDSNEAATSAPVTWPDGSPGTYTADTLSTAFPGAVDAYHITYGSPVTKTYTQPAITRDAAGAATAVPAIVVT